MNPVIYEVLLVLGYPLTALSVWLLGRREVTRLFLSAATQEQRLLNQIDLLGDELRPLQQQLDMARASLLAEQGKSARYFHKISDFEAERDRIQQLYTEHTIGHGNAQQLMMNTIEDLARQLQARGGRPQIPKVLSVVRDEYLAKHEMPVRAAAEAIQKAQAAAPPTPPAAETA
jgi:hypothetical protein